MVSLGLSVVLRLGVVAGLGVALGVPCASAQSAPAAATSPAPAGLRNPRPTAASGTVTGHVYCTDTQRPARFADVDLLREYIPGGGNASAAPAAPSYQSVGRGRTALDGSFVIPGVAAGDYYVMATQTGYVSPLAVARAAGKALGGVPLTHVAENRSADVLVSMDRGAVVTGRVTYDDGSPVAGVSVRLRPATDATVGGGGGRGGFGGPGGDTGTGFTDDRGVFRASGLSPGKYLVVATVQTETTGGRGGGFGGRGSFAAPISVYAPATQHRSEGRVLEIHGGETVDGADISVALAGLHVVKGSVESKADAHLLNSGSVTLTDTQDGSFSRTATVGRDGTYFLEYLPAGSYTLSVSGADRSGGGRREDSDTTRRYVSATTNVVIGEHDVAVDPVLLAEAPASQ